MTGVPEMDQVLKRPILERTMRKPISIGRILAWAALIVMLLITLAPFWWVIRTSLSTNRELFANATSLLPAGLTFGNYLRVLGFLDTEAALAMGGSGQKINFFLYLRNSVIVSTLVVVGQLLFSSLSAYAFARLRFPFREKIFLLYLAALMIPGIVTLIPNYIFVRNLNWFNTFQGIVAPVLLFSPFTVFFLRQFFLGINRELEEAARLDGTGVFGTFVRIILPISTPPLVTMGILTFIGTWNEYLWPLLVGSKEEATRVLTVALGIFRSQTPQGSPDWTGLMAGAMLSALPGIILFLVLGKRILNSIQFSGYK